MKKKSFGLLSILLVLCFITGSTVMAAVTTTVLNTTDANRGNCVLYARSRQPKLPYNLNTLDDKKAIMNSTTAAAGYVAVMDTGLTAGHVAYVTKVSGTQITIEEANYQKDTITRRVGTASELNILGYYKP